MRVTVIHEVECSYCRKVCRGSTNKMSYLKLLWHVRTCENIEDPPPFFKTLWQLFWWKDS